MFRDTRNGLGPGAHRQAEALSLRRTAGTATALGVVLVMITMFVGGAAIPAGALSVVTVDGNPKCTDGDISTKDDGPALGGFSRDGVTITYTDAYTVAGVTVPAGYEIDAVIVKGGPRANIYTDGPYRGLIAPSNNGGNQAAISHVEVCWSQGEEPTTTTTQPPTTTTKATTTTTEAPTTTTTEPTTTTTKPQQKKFDVSFGSRCAVDKAGNAVYSIYVSISGPAGTTGSIKQDGGQVTEFTLVDERHTVTLAAHQGANSVWVSDADGNPVGRHAVELEDCGLPVATSAVVTGSCVADAGAAQYSIAVNVVGEAGATGTVTVNGAVASYELPEGGVLDLVFDGSFGENHVYVADDVAGEIASGIVALDDCTPDKEKDPKDPDPGQEPEPKPAATAVVATATCEADSGVATLEITITGDPNATGIVAIDGSEHSYSIDANGVSTITVPSAVGEHVIVVVDDNAGQLDALTISVATCDLEVLAGSGTRPGSPSLASKQAPSVNPPPAVNASSAVVPEASSAVPGSDAVAVLGARVQATELPFTGVDDGPLAIVGGVLIGAGAVLLTIARRRDAATGAAI